MPLRGCCQTFREISFWVLVGSCSDDSLSVATESSAEPRPGDGLSARREGGSVACLRDVVVGHRRALKPLRAHPRSSRDSVELCEVGGVRDEVAGAHAVPSQDPPVAPRWFDEDVVHAGTRSSVPSSRTSNTIFFLAQSGEV